MGASVTQPAGIPRSGSLLPFQVTSREQVATLLLVSLSFKRVLIQGKISKQVSAMSDVQRIPAQSYKDIDSEEGHAQRLSEHQWQRFCCCSKVATSDAAEGRKPSWVQSMLGASKKHRLNCLLMQIVSSPSFLA